MHSAKALSCTARLSARLRGNGSALQRACSYAVHPSTGSGRTACNLPGPFLAPLALRLGSGGTAVLCRELAPTLFTFRQAQGERLATCQGPLLHRSPFGKAQGDRLCFAESLLLRCSPFDRLRANGMQPARALTCTAHSLARLRGNGSALQRACSYAVHPSTGSGRTACILPRHFLAPFTFRLGSGERQCFAESLLLRCSPFDRLRANGHVL